MLTMNETYSNEFSSFSNQQMPCYINRNVWILTHWSLKYSVELSIVYVYLILSCILLVLLVFNPNWYRLFRIIFENYYLRINHAEEEKERIFLYSIILLIKEAILISVYVFFAFMYHWLVLVHDQIEITSMTFYLWSVEASHLPNILISTCYFGTIDNFLLLYRSFTLFAILIKVPVFVLMRYAESEKNFFLNNAKAHFFYTFCK